MKIITIASDANFPGHQQLIRSLQHFNYDYDVMITPFEFGRQMKTIYQWCKANWDGSYIQMLMIPLRSAGRMNCKVNCLNAK